MSTTATKAVKPEPIPFAALTTAEQGIVNVIQPLRKQEEQIATDLKALRVKIGGEFFRWQALGEQDSNRYSVMLPGKDEPSNVSRFEAAYNSVGISRATAHRYLRAYREHLKSVNPVPSAITQMATTNGVLNLTEEIAQEAIADAYLAAGQPSNPTPQQCMTIVADACERAAETPANVRAQFQALLSKALKFARENHLSAVDTNQSWDETFANFTKEGGWTVVVGVGAIGEL